MSKIVKCLLLKVDNVIVTEIEEVPSELGEPDCRLVNPFRIDAEGNLTPWPEVTDQKEMMIHSDSILTIVDPTPDLLSKYFEMIA